MMTTQPTRPAHRAAKDAVLALVVLAPLLSGCSYTFRTAVVPTLDTQGNVGMQITVGAGGGITDPQKYPDEHQRVGVIGPGLEFGGGVVAGGTPNYAAAVSFDYVEVARNPGTLGFRFGVYGGAYGTSFAKQQGFGGFRGALQFNVARPAKGQMLTLGPLAQVTLRDPGPSPAEVGLGLALDWNFVESWSLPSCRNDACRFARRDR